MAVSGTTVYCAQETTPNQGVHVFSTETAHNTRASVQRHFTLPSRGQIFDVVLFGDDLYLVQAIGSGESSFSFGGQIYTVDKDTANNTEAVARQVWNYGTGAWRAKLAVTEEFMYVSGHVGLTSPTFRIYERLPLSYESIQPVDNFLGIPSSGNVSNVRYGIDVIGARLYLAGPTHTGFRTYELVEERPPIDRSLTLPPGCTQAVGLDILE